MDLLALSDTLGICGEQLQKDETNCKNLTKNCFVPIGGLTKQNVREQMIFERPGGGGGTQVYK